MENDGRFVTTSQAARILGMSQNNVLRTADHALHERGGPGRPNYYWRHMIQKMRESRDRHLCHVCGDQPKRGAGYATCGHPRCVATQRRASRPAKRLERHMEGSSRPAKRLERHMEGSVITESARIRQTWSELAGLPHSLRLMKTAERNRVNLATVMGVVRESA
jgi:hypothetical protein